jgi:hypothetical protein
MPEFAHTTPPLGSCPTAEELACYIDRALSPEEAARVTTHLASCESCFEVYTEVVRFQLEEPEVEGEPGEVVRFPVATARGRGRAPWWSSIAALLVLGVGAAGLLRVYLFALPPALATERIASTLHPKATDIWVEPRNRGSEEEGDDKPYEVVSFDAGARLVNLQVSLEAGDAKNAQDAITGIYTALHAAGMGQEGELQGAYQDLTGAVEASKAPASLLPRANSLGKRAREFFDPLYLDLGQWAVAGRFAAISKDPAFFRQADSRSFLRRVLWRDRLGLKDAKLPEESRKDFYRIGEILDQSELQPSDYAELRQHFDAILEANYAF